MPGWSNERLDKQWQFQLRLCDATGTAILAVDRRPTPLQKKLKQLMEDYTHNEL